MWTTEPSLNQKHLTCPFCGLACDDLSITPGDRGIESLDPKCDKAKQGFRLALQAVSRGPRSNGAPVSMEVALQQSVQLLKSARAPLFAGLATDVNGMRATLELADRCGGVLDHLNGDAMFRNIRVVQDNGWVACTLSEARNRADLILIIGTQCFDRFPRFVDRVLLPRESLFSPKAGRHLVMLGPWQNNRLPATLKDYAPITLHAHPSQWADVAGMLRARLGNRPVDSGRLGGQLAEGVEELARLLREAKYSVITWSAAELTFPHAELVIERWAALARDLNQTTRSSVLPLAGNQGDITSNQVCTWQTGYPLRTSLQYGYPVHDSRLFRYQDLIENNTADLLIWISSLDPEAKPPACDLPTIVFGHPGMELGQEVEVFLPVGVPGVDHTGHGYRSDTVCTLPLGQLIERGLPSAATLLRTLLDRLGD